MPSGPVYVFKWKGIDPRTSQSQKNIPKTYSIWLIRVYYFTFWSFSLHLGGKHRLSSLDVFFISLKYGIQWKMMVSSQITDLSSLLCKKIYISKSSGKCTKSIQINENAQVLSSCVFISLTNLLCDNLCMKAMRNQKHRRHFSEEGDKSWHQTLLIAQNGIFQ